MIDEEAKIQEALNFIRNAGRKVGSSELVEYMQYNAPWRLRTGESRTRSTIIPKLKKRGSIKISKHRHGQKQLLSFNHKSEFDRIVALTDKIKKVIEAMDKPIENSFLQGAEWASNSSTEEAVRGAPALQNLQDQIQLGYRQRYEIMLQFLWNRTNSVIQSEKDKQTLHTMIVNLMIKITDQFWRHRQLKEIFKFLAYKPEILKPSLWKKMGITKELMDELNAPPEEFVTLFELGQS